MEERIKDYQSIKKGRRKGIKVIKGDPGRQRDTQNKLGTATRKSRCESRGGYSEKKVRSGKSGGKKHLTTSK